MTNLTFAISPPGPPSGPSLLALFPVTFGVGPGLSTLPHSLLHSLPCGGLAIPSEVYFYDNLCHLVFHPCLPLDARYSDAVLSGPP